MVDCGKRKVFSLKTPISPNKHTMQQLEGREPTHPSWCGTGSCHCHPSFGVRGHRIMQMPIRVGLHRLSFQPSAGRQGCMRQKRPFLSYLELYFSQPVLLHSSSLFLLLFLFFSYFFSFSWWKHPLDVARFSLCFQTTTSSFSACHSSPLHKHRSLLDFLVGFFGQTLLKIQSTSFVS